MTSSRKMVAYNTSLSFGKVKIGLLSFTSLTLICNLHVLCSAFWRPPSLARMVTYRSFCRIFLSSDYEKIFAVMHRTPCVQSRLGIISSVRTVDFYHKPAPKQRKLPCKSLSHEHNNVAIVRFELTIIVAENGVTIHYTTLPTILQTIAALRKKNWCLFL